MQEWIVQNRDGGFEKQGDSGEDRGFSRNRSAWWLREKQGVLQGAVSDRDIEVRTAGPQEADVQS